MKTFIRNFSKRREIKKKLVNGWISKVSKKDAKNYKIRHYLMMCATGFLGFPAILLLSFPTLFDDILAGMTSLEGYKRGATVMAFFCFYVVFSEAIISSASRVKKVGRANTNNAYLRVFPSWVEEPTVESQAGNLIKIRNRLLIIGFSLSFTFPLLVFSGWNDIQGFLGVFLASLFSYTSLISFSIISYYINLKIKHFSSLEHIAIAFIFLVSVLSMVSSDLLIILDSCFRAFPPYWFFMGEGFYSFGLMEWLVHGLMFIGAALLWKPLWTRLVQNLQEAEVDGESELIRELTRDEAHKKLLAPDVVNPFFSKFLWKRVLWFVALLIFACFCFQQCLHREDIIGLFWRLSGYGLTMFSFSQLIILSFEGFAQGIGKTLKISQSRDAFEIGLFPLNADGVLKCLMNRGLCRTLPIGILGGLGFVMIHLYGEVAPFQTISLWNTFYIGFLLFIAYESSAKLNEVLLVYAPKNEKAMMNSFLNLFFMMGSMVNFLILLLLTFLPFLQNFEGGNQFSTWVATWACYGMSALIAISWILHAHRKKVMTLTFLRQS